MFSIRGTALIIFLACSTPASLVSAFKVSTFEDDEYGRICTYSTYNGRSVDTICENVCADDSASGNCENVYIEFDDNYIPYEIVRCTSCNRGEKCVSAAKADLGDDAVFEYYYKYDKHQKYSRCVDIGVKYLPSV